MSKPYNIAALRKKIRGEVLQPVDPDYEGVRRVWNGMIDRRPALIIRCTETADIINAVHFSRDHGLLVAVRGGGHSFPGYSVCDGGVMIDLSPMKAVQVIPEAKIVHAEAGVTWGEFDRETQVFGLATTGGMITHTGIAGLTLGGGFGWLCRKHGLTIDNLLSAEIVTAEGRLLHASTQENSDLFWGLRGGGGNFGIVSRFVYQLHPLGLLFGGLVIYPLAQARQVLRAFRDLAASAPDELVAVGAFLTTPDGQRGIGVAAGYFGESAKGEQLIQPVRELGSPIMDQFGQIPYTSVQTLFDAVALPHRRYYMRSNYMDTMSDEAIDIFAEGYGKVPSPLSAIVIITLGGAVSRVDADATAYRHRDARFTMSVSGCWMEMGEDKANIEWLKRLWDNLAPHLSAGVYVNELADEGTERVRAAYGGATYDRLAALKTRYDPGNLFRLNQNIPPLAEASAP